MSTDATNVEPVDLDQKTLTTRDNPYNPKTDWYKWRQWDHEHGYFTEEYIGRLVVMEDDIDIDDEYKMNMITNKVINEILEQDTLGIYQLV